MTAGPPTGITEAIGGALRTFFQTNGYTEDRFNALSVFKAVRRYDTIAQVLLWRKVDKASTFGVLVRLFALGLSIPLDQAQSAISPEALDAMLIGGLLARRDDRIEPCCLIKPYNGLLLANDIEISISGDELPNLVLGVNQTTQHLALRMIDLPGASRLDLGTGCGTLGLLSARLASTVTATDINTRALAYAAFNATLNGFTNFSFCQGDRFEPIGDRRFDLIVSNPPFFLNPNPLVSYTDNPLELDDFVFSLAAQAPAHLNDGGFFQMLCEWVVFDDAPPHMRLVDLLSTQDCDVLVMKDYEIRPVDYIAQREAEGSVLLGAATEATIRARLDYFARKNVTMICGGLVTMRRRAGRNWFIFEDQDGTITDPIGAQLIERFETQTILVGHPGEALLTLKPRVAADVRLVQQSDHDGTTWQIKKLRVERTVGIGRRLGFDSALITDLIGRFDGSRPLGEILAETATIIGMQQDQLVAAALPLIEKLASQGLITFA